MTFRNGVVTPATTGDASAARPQSALAIVDFFMVLITCNDVK